MLSDLKRKVNAIKESQDETKQIPKPKDWPLNIYDARIAKKEEEKKKGGSILGGMMRNMGLDMDAIQDPLRFGMKSAVDYRDQAILEYLQKKGLYDTLMKE